MLEGKSLQDLAIELDRQNKAKVDYLVPSTKIKYLADTGDVLIHYADDAALELRPTDHTHSQISEKLGIPKRYYDIMKDKAPELLATNINHWLQDQKKNFLIRSLDGNARAFLSDRYRTLDNYEVASIVLPLLVKHGARVESCEVTESKLYIKAVTPKFEHELGVGDPVQAGIVISNSEIGAGTLSFKAMLFRLVCKNGLILPKEIAGFSATHLGVQQKEIGILELSQDTKKKINSAFWGTFKDSIEGMFVNNNFNLIVDKFKAAKLDVLEKPVDTVQVLQKEFQLNEFEHNGILQHLLAGGDINKFGLINAITRTAQDVTDYDRSTELEELGGKILELPRTSWERLSA